MVSYGHGTEIEKIEEKDSLLGIVECTGIVHLKTGLVEGGLEVLQTVT